MFLYNYYKISKNLKEYVQHLLSPGSLCLKKFENKMFSYLLENGEYDKVVPDRIR